MSSDTTLLLLIRHAETPDNAANRLSGWTDTPLSPRGERQVRLLAEHVNRAHGHAAAIYSSPLTRARRTAEAIGALTGHEPVLVDDLREMYFGDLDGRAFEELQRTHPDLLREMEDEAVEDAAWPRGESRLQFSARARRAMDEIARRHPGQAVCIVTHGGVISTFLTAVHGESPALWRRWIVENASLTEVEWDPERGAGRLLRHGDAEHLADLEQREADDAPQAER